MTNNKFQVRFDDWKKAFLSNKTQYSDQIWDNIDSHPLDNLFLELADLYQKASESQKIVVGDFFKTNSKWTWQLVLFIRRSAKLLNMQNAEVIVSSGISVADLISEMDDFRDIIVSLVILKYAAERMEIDLKPKLEAELISANDVFKNILSSTINHNPSSVQWTIKNFGPREWSNEPR